MLETGLQELGRHRGLDRELRKRSEFGTDFALVAKGFEHGNSRFTGKFTGVQERAQPAWSRCAPVLGSDTVKQLAARFNLPVDQLAKVLAQQLPTAVDHASPDGKLPHTA